MESLGETSTADRYLNTLDSPKLKIVSPSYEKVSQQNVEGLVLTADVVLQCMMDNVDRSATSPTVVKRSSDRLGTQVQEISVTIKEKPNGSVVSCMCYCTILTHPTLDQSNLL